MLPLEFYVWVHELKELVKELVKAWKIELSAPQLKKNGEFCYYVFVHLYLRFHYCNNGGL